MAQFAKSTFCYASYATFRPSYPQSLYEIILQFHEGARDVCVDLGCGHGVVTRYLADFFTRVTGTDPSNGMIEQAKSRTLKDEYPNVTYANATAENLIFVKDDTVDLIVAGQAAHWFDHKGALWHEMKRVLRSEGTLAFWGYTDPTFIDYPNATRILHENTYGNSDRTMGPYWSQPGRSVVENRLRDIQPPVRDWALIQRIEYQPSTKGPKTGQGTMFLNKKLQIGECMSFARTWSAASAWRDDHPYESPRDLGGTGDVVDYMFDAMRAAEPSWQQTSWKTIEVEIEWGSALLLARKK